MNDKIELPEVVPATPRVESIHGHTLLWFHKDKAGELGPDHGRGPGVFCFRENVQHSFRLGGELANQAVPNVRMSLPWIRPGRSPPWQAVCVRHNARAREALEQLTI